MRGADLARDYAAEVIAPILDGAVPGMPIGLARLGSGSDVLGHDDTISRDHDWGLRLTVLVPEPEIARIDALLDERLPTSWRGLPTRFPVSWDPRHHQRAEVASTLGFARFRTGLDLSRDPTPVEWLSLTGQSVLELTAGPVFRDDDGSLGRLRERLGWYPHDVWLMAIAATWHKIGQELPFIARTAQLGDEVGSRALAARLVATAMRLGFLLERRWAPYPKWLGTAFLELPRVGALTAPLRRALASASGRARQDALVEALDRLATVQGEIGLPTLIPATERFHSRPMAGLRGLPEHVREAVADPVLRAFPLVGIPEIWSDSVDLLGDGERRIRMTEALYGTTA